jgi:conjugal transfer pilus assembly protein TraU
MSSGVRLRRGENLRAWAEALLRAALRGLGALLVGACALVFAEGAAAQAPTPKTEATCKGKFPNPITDICWSCMFPIRLGNADLLTLGQEDSNNAPGGNPFCFCANGTVNPKVGIKSEFWEPSRLFEAVRKPHCYPTLGGVVLDPGFDAPSHEQRRQGKTDSSTSFYNAHWYINPIMYWLEVVLDDSCLEHGGFDIAYSTEFDPLWSDSQLSFVLAPDSALFANVIAQAACAADCVAATAGFSVNTLFWCAGCQGSMYPLTGWVGRHIGGVQASTLLMQRMTNKLHRQGLMWAGSGSAGLCGFYPQVIMDKTNYKSQMLYPIPNTTKLAGRCCQPYGRSTVATGAGKEIPYIGEDFSYQIFRKRSCCAGSSVWQLAF